MSVENPKSVQVGDWIRFHQNGRLVTGVVEYVTERASWDRSVKLSTDIGQMHADMVLEVRRREGAT